MSFFFPVLLLRLFFTKNDEKGERKKTHSSLGGSDLGVGDLLDAGDDRFLFILNGCAAKKEEGSKEEKKGEVSFFFSVLVLSRVPFRPTELKIKKLD